MSNLVSTGRSQWGCLKSSAGTAGWASPESRDRFPAPVHMHTQPDADPGMQYSVFLFYDIFFAHLGELIEDSRKGVIGVWAGRVSLGGSGVGRLPKCTLPPTHASPGPPQNRRTALVRSRPCASSAVPPAQAPAGWGDRGSLPSPTNILSERCFLYRGRGSNHPPHLGGSRPP